MTRTPLLFASVVALAGAFAHPALAQDNAATNAETYYAAPGDRAWPWQFRYSTASPTSYYRMTRNALLGREVVTRNGQVVGRISNDARYVNGDVAGVEVALGSDRAVWITVPNLRYDREEGILMTDLTPREYHERANLASNNPYPVG